MADKTDNIKTKLSFDGEAQYKAACKEINSTLKLLNSEMKLVTAEYKSNASSAEALKAKQEVLRKTYDEQKKKHGTPLRGIGFGGAAAQECPPGTAGAVRVAASPCIGRQAHGLCPRRRDRKRFPDGRRQGVRQ